MENSSELAVPWGLEARTTNSQDTGAGSDLHKARLQQQASTAQKQTPAATCTAVPFGAHSPQPHREICLPNKPAACAISPPALGMHTTLSAQPLQVIRLSIGSVPYTPYVRGSPSVEHSGPPARACHSGHSLCLKGSNFSKGGQ